MKGYTQHSYSCPAQHEYECCVYPIDAAERVFTLEVAEDKTRFDQTAICLQGSGEDVLSGIGLQLADEQRRRHPPSLSEPASRSRSSQCRRMKSCRIVPLMRGARWRARCSRVRR
jgi:hypothetical protein